MANAKSRLKAPKSATTKRGRGNSKQSLTGVKDDPACSASLAGNSSVMGQINNTKPLKTNEKVPLLYQNGSVAKDKYSLKPSPRALRLSKRNSLLNIQPVTKKIGQSKSQNVSKSGRIRKKIKGNLKLIDNILKRELLIDGDKTKTTTDSIQPVNNNNLLEINYQNKCANETPKTQKSNQKNELDSTAKNSSLAIKYYDNKSEGNAKKNKQKTVNKKNKANDKNASKTKQVTLSNGLVLTLTLFQCDYCKKMFSSKSSLRRHIYAHIKLKPHACKKCSKKFRYKTHLQNHVNKHHPEGKPEHLCHICNKTFMLEENLSLHLASHVKNENSYKCIYCEKKFSYHLLLIQHEKQHLVTGQYQCTICNMSYNCRNQLSLHVKSHLKIKDYICQYCGKEFLRMNSMKRHVQICHGGHRIQCPICKKQLKGHLTEHMRTHKQARPHKCELCGQRFIQSTQLTVHKRSHTGARPYICKICTRPFTHSNALMLHIRRHTGEKPFPCAMCPMSFSQLPHMKAHMRNIHRKENPYKCPKCDEFFKLKCQVDMHTSTCKVGDRELTFEEKIQASVQYEEVEVVSVMTLSRMRFLLALLFTRIATKERLKFLGFNKRLVDDLLLESLEAIGQAPCKDQKLSPISRLKANIQLLLNGTVPKEQMEKFQRENKTTEDILELLTGEKKKED